MKRADEMGSGGKFDDDRFRHLSSITEITTTI
jgi:hypothetical protein